MLTYIFSNLKANIEQVRPVPDKDSTNNIEIITCNLSMWNMTWLLSSVLTYGRSVELKLTAAVNWTIKLSQKQRKEWGKENSIRWCQLRNKPGAIRQNRAWLAQSCKLKTNWRKKRTQLVSAPMPGTSHTRWISKLKYA